MPTTNAATPSLMDNFEFITELETMDKARQVATLPTPLLDRVHEMEDGFVPGQTRLHTTAAKRSVDHSAREGMPDRNAFHPAPLEEDEQDDETSVTISARVAAFAVMASGLAGAGVAALVFHERLALLLR